MKYSILLIINIQFLIIYCSCSTDTDTLFQKEYNSLSNEKVPDSITKTLKLYLDSAKLYTSQNKPDLVQYYLREINNKIEEISNLDTLENIYEEIAEYYKQTGNLEKALEYKSLQYELQKKIIASSNADKLLEMSKQYELSLDAKNSRICQIIFISIIIGILLVCIFMIRIINLRTKIKQDRHKVEEVEEKSQLIVEERTRINQLEDEIIRFKFVEDIYINIFSGWMKVNRKVNLLMKENDLDKQFPIHKQIRKILVKHRKRSDERFLKMAKYVLAKQPYADLLFPMLDEKRLVLFMLCFHKYKKYEMILILETHYVILQIWKYDLRNKLIDCGFTKQEADDFVFFKEEDDENDNNENEEKEEDDALVSTT